MTVIYQDETEKLGTYCLIKDLYAIIEVLGKYQALHITRYVGDHCPEKPDTRFLWCNTEDEAKKEINRMKRFE